VTGVQAVLSVRVNAAICNNHRELSNKGSGSKEVGARRRCGKKKHAWCQRRNVGSINLLASNSNFTWRSAVARRRFLRGCNQSNLAMAMLEACGDACGGVAPPAPRTSAGNRYNHQCTRGASKRLMAIVSARAFSWYASGKLLSSYILKHKRP